MTPSPSSLRLVVSDHMIEQFRFPKTKKRRIRNKWMKRPENWRPMRKLLFMKEQNIVLVHPIYAARVERAEMLKGDTVFRLI